MKINKLILLLTLSLFLFNCTKESQELESTIDSNLVLEQTESRSNRNLNCILSTNCNRPLFIISIPPNTPEYETINVTFPDVDSVEEATCIRRQYFTCFRELRMSMLQPTQVNKETWMRPIDDTHTGDVISGTMEQDDRVCRGPHCD